ncbi:hypothetical protein [Andreprevotia chitinilytica]|uniref:hypothetical protein n=1 Tax=Andreprevotia chitinilytica TaxID=396808 RepID=UPI0005508CC1|nr:hypothetical protein [Andreprevotia chitinilytica]
MAKRLQDQTAVFIVRIWCEEREIENAAGEWRGVVEHVRSNQRMFFRTLEGMSAFMQPFLEEVGIAPQDRWWEGVEDSLSLPPGEQVE